MNSTNKIVVARIRKSLLEDILALNENTGKGFTAPRQFTPQEVMESFDNWYGEYERKQTPNRQDAFVEWLRCLPSVLDQPYADHEIEDLLNVWLEGVPNNRKKPFTSDELWNKMGYLIYRELNKMIKEDAKDA